MVQGRKGMPMVPLAKAAPVKAGIIPENPPGKPADTPIKINQVARHLRDPAPSGVNGLMKREMMQQKRLPSGQKLTAMNGLQDPGNRIAKGQALVLPIPGIRKIPAIVPGAKENLRSVRMKRAINPGPLEIHPVNQDFRKKVNQKRGLTEKEQKTKKNRPEISVVNGMTVLVTTTEAARL